MQSVSPPLTNKIAWHLCSFSGCAHHSVPMHPHLGPWGSRLCTGQIYINSENWNKTGNVWVVRSLLDKHIVVDIVEGIVEYIKSDPMRLKGYSWLIITCKRHLHTVIVQSDTDSQWHGWGITLGSQDCGRHRHADSTVPIIHMTNNAQMVQEYVEPASKLSTRDNALI